MPVLTDEERIGTTLAGRYRLDRILGRGGMGVVYEGEHTWSKRRVAVKLLLGELARDQSAVQRFLQEARTAAAIDHPNVVQILDVGQAEDGAVFMAQELLRGQTLADTLHARGRLSTGETMELLLPVIDALAVAHEAGIVHRDLKPENVFLAQDATGRVVPKLLDFGIAKVLRGGLATMTGTMVGSPAFMSPEQAECRKDVGPATDVWSMGVVLHRCLAGAFPFDFPEDASPASVLAAILTRAPRSLAGRAPELPSHVVAAVDRALAKEPRERHPSMRAFHKALRSETSGVSATMLGARPSLPESAATVSATTAVSTGTQMWTPAPAKGPTPFAWQGGRETNGRSARRPSSTLVAAAVVAGALVIAGGGGIWMLRDPPTESRPIPLSSDARGTRAAAAARLPAIAADAGANSASLTAPLAPRVEHEPLIAPLDTGPAARPDSSVDTRRSREPIRARWTAPREVPPGPPIVIPPPPRPRPAPTVIDNGIRIPD